VGFGDRVDATLLDGAVDSFDASTVACDPYELTGCPADAACYLGGAGETVCIVPPGTSAAATACAATPTCTPGDACVRLDLCDWNLSRVPSERHARWPQGRRLLLTYP